MRINRKVISNALGAYRTSKNLHFTGFMTEFDCRWTVWTVYLLYKGDVNFVKNPQHAPLVELLNHFKQGSRQVYRQYINCIF